jgi:hypothetical protein
MVSYGFVLACLAALHVVRADASRVEYLSEYALGPYGLLMTQAFVAGGAGTIALALAIARRAAGSFFSCMTSMLLLTGGAATCLLAAYPTDPDPLGPSTPAGEMHSMLGYLRVVCSAFSATLWALAIRRDSRLASHRRATVIGAALTFVAVTLIVYLPDSHTGLVQRFWITVNLGWGFTVAHAIGGFRLRGPAPFARTTGRRVGAAVSALLRVLFVRRADARRADEELLAVGQRDVLGVRRRRPVFRAEAVDDELGARGNRRLVETPAQQ